MSEYLFAYGTLQAGLAPADIAPLIGQLRSLGEGFLTGTLYDFGTFPALVLGRVPPGRVFGTVYALPPAPGILEALDAYEEFDPASPARSQFVRRTCTVTWVRGGEVDCWVYVFNGATASAPVIPEGRYRRRAT